MSGRVMITRHSPGPVLRGLLVVLIILMTADRGVGAVIGSPHDLFGQGYLSTSGDKLKTNPQCDFCHFVSSDDRPLIWRAVPPSLRTLGTVGITCSSCHDGVSIMDRNVDAGLTVFHPDSHGLDPNMAPIDTFLTNTGLPNLSGGAMNCTTCHDPHNEANRPFLRVPLLGLCERCHRGRKAVGAGPENRTGDHPVSVEPYDKIGGASPISVQQGFKVAFPLNYPAANGRGASGVHWMLGGHLGYGSQGKIECWTCHAIHGRDKKGPVDSLLAVDPVRSVSDEFCEGCHRGERGDGEKTPPFPNPGGTVTGRTYHPEDDDLSNGPGSIVAIADTVELEGYVWGSPDPDTDQPRILCTTCHTAHDGLAYSPGLVKISDTIRNDSGINSFCEICHRLPPEGHHGYNEWDKSSLAGSTIAIPLGNSNLGFIYGSQLQPGTVYCGLCHRAHNAGYRRKEVDYIPILVDKGTMLCAGCHRLGVSHFMGDPTLPSTYDVGDPPLKRDQWPASLKYSYYGGEGELPGVVTCLSCHDIGPILDGAEQLSHYLLAPAGEDVEWAPGYSEEYLCTGCHGEAPATVGGGATHPLLDADTAKFSTIYSDHLMPGETSASYTMNNLINCQSCHLPHGAALPGGVYMLKIARGTNTAPQAIHPKIEYTALCNSCHPAAEY